MIRYQTSDDGRVEIAVGDYIAIYMPGGQEIVRWVCDEFEEEVEAATAAAGAVALALTESAYDVAKRIDSPVLDSENSSSEKMHYIITGVYTDTPNLQPFTFTERAASPHEALVQLLNRIGDYNERDLKITPDENLKQVCVTLGVRPVSIIETNEIPDELLHTIDEYASVSA